MSKKAKSEYLIEIRKRYFLSSKTDKQLILDEFCKNCGYNRKYAIRLINKLSKPNQKTRRIGRPKKYNHILILEFLKYLWISSNLVCSKRLRAMIPIWLPFYHQSIPQNIQTLILNISPATIDRLLHKIKRKYKKFGLSTTKPGSLLKKQIPIIHIKVGNFTIDTFFKNFLWVIIPLLYSQQIS